LLQQAVPTTFGLKAAGWLAGVAEARGRLAGVELAAQLGGAAGTLASLGDKGPAGSTPRSSGWPSRGCPGMPTGCGSPSSSMRSGSSAVHAARSRST
jgi:hypothetical protein